MPSHADCLWTARTLVLACLLFGLSVAGASVVINEYLSANVHNLTDGDGDTPDWLELYNRGAQTVDLDGYGLSDREDTPGEWVFPELLLRPGGHLLIFASGKDRKVAAPHWESVIDRGDRWRYRVNTSAPPSEWRELAFDDSGWDEGPSGLGYGDNDDATMVPPCISLSARRRFTLDDPELVKLVCLHIDFDDGFVAWLNGVEITRRLVGTPGVPPPWNMEASTYHEAELFRDLVPETILFPPEELPLQAGENVLAIQVHNYGPEDTDLTLIPILSLGMEEPPGDSRGVSEVVRFWVPHLHASFKIDADGETLVLHDAAGTLLDRVETGAMTADRSRGRSLDGGPDWHYFAQPTPETPNGAGTPQAWLAEPSVSPPGGFHDGPLAVSIADPSPDTRVTYTLDAGEPLASSPEYAGPIEIEETTVLRARAFRSGYQPSPIASHTYILEDQPHLPVVCLVTDPPNLWDDEQGIYVRGPHAWPVHPYYNANFWMDWERPVHVELHDPLGQGFRQDLGLKIHGGITRTFPQKSLRLIARGGYGADAIAYPVFPDLEVTNFERLVLRNAGNDWCRSMLRDGLAHRLVQSLGLETQAYRPARVYLNGTYWGLYNIREKIDRFYLEDHLGIDPEEIDMLEGRQEVMEGDAEHYEALLAFLRSHDLSNDDTFAQVAEMMDVENFAAYYITRIFYANTDWPGHNLRYWRPRTGAGRWRWILFDTEMGLGMNPNRYMHNTLAHALEPDSPEWRNAPWSTFLARKLLENAAFRRDFINRYADCLNGVFHPEQTVAVVEELAGGIEEEIPRHMDRWGYDVGIWAREVAAVEEFLRRRPAHARAHLMGQFGLEDTLRLSLDISPPGAGSICLTALRVDDAWSGIYFRGVPIELTVEPENGYRFRGWSDSTLTSDLTVEIAPTEDYALTALFAGDSGGLCQWVPPVPNPIRAETTLTFYLREGGHARVLLCDVAGRRIATLADRAFAPGEHPLAWSGVDRAGRRLPAGVYFLYLEAGGDHAVERLVVIPGL